MKKYILLTLALCFALMAGCGLLDKPEPEPTHGVQTQPDSEPAPDASTDSNGIVPEPPTVGDREPVEYYPQGSAVPVESAPPEEQPDDSLPSEQPENNEPIINTVRPDAEFCGEWFAREEDSSGQLRAIKLILGDDGTVQFNYGIPYREVLETFDGRWREDGDILVLDLYGGPVADDGGYEEVHCRDLEVNFRWEEQGIALICEHVGGNPLLPGTSGEWFTFRPFDAFKLSGTWCTDNSRLQLKENGGCTYSVTEDGVLHEEYDGTWRYKDGQLTLSVTMCGGCAYEAGRRGQIAGTYREEYSPADELVLSHISGSAITGAMEANGTDTFKKQ